MSKTLHNITVSGAQQRNPDGSYAVAEALTFVPNNVVVADENAGRKLVYGIDR